MREDDYCAWLWDLVNWLVRDDCKVLPDGPWSLVSGESRWIDVPPR